MSNYSVSEKLIERYIKVRALAESGVDGERDNARTLLAKMVKENPTLEGEARRWFIDEQKKRENKDNPHGSTSNAKPEPPKGHSTQNGKKNQHQAPPPHQQTRRPEKERSTRPMDAGYWSEEEAPSDFGPSSFYSGGHSGQMHGHEQPGASTGNWERLFNMAGEFWSTAQDFAQKVSDAEKGTEAAREVNVTARVTAADNVVISVRIPLDLYAYVTEMNEAQRFAFRKALNMMFDEQVAALIEDY